ncbi:FAD-linked oxidoreductase afoF [Colletotrichum higginsianum]|uniref:FAD-linked oxidoreductase afoF n=1 Tax=Colletotrichum higginsianum TaxID=80884 RepID=A0A4T0W3B1_9PEZI|nr:FAD-linked oxidoreductase afoF [Colletotrichum higginsianum]
MSFKKLLWLPLWLSLCVAGSDAAVVKRVDVKSVLSDPANKWSKKTTLSFPDSAAFIGATERWTVFNPPTYTAAISPATEKDVIKIVNLAASNNIPFLATGGRHGYTTTVGDLDNGLAIDLSLLNDIKINKGQKTLTVGPGVRVNEILDLVHKAGFFLQTGTAYCPSVIGVALGGGVGRFTGLYGLMIDDLVSVRIVTANGTVLEASKKTNADLFWGIRGAGANFGIITSATFNVHPLLNKGNIFTTDLIFPANMTSAFFKAVETYSGRMPAEMAGIAIQVYDPAVGQSQVMTNWIYVGPEADARRVLAPILDLRPPYAVSSNVPANKLINSTFSGFGAAVCQEGVIRDIYSVNVRNYSAATWDKTFEKMARFFEDHPGGRGSALQYELYPNQAMASVSKDATAWPWRETTGYFQTSMTWEQGDTATANAAGALSRELRDVVVATSGYPDATIFVNYAHGDEKLENIYGKDKLPRLAGLKKTWDPTHMFSFNNRLPTQYP